MSETGSRQAGFTLLETLVMAGVMVLIAMLIVPNMVRALDVLSLQETTRLLEADLRVARATALRTGQKVDLEVTNHGRQYDWIGGTRYMPPGVTLAMSGGQLVIYPDGSVNNVSFAISAKGRTYNIDIDPINGSVMVER